MSLNLGAVVYPCKTIGAIAVVVNIYDLPDGTKPDGVTAAVTKSGVKNVEWKPVVFDNGVGTILVKQLNDAENPYTVSVRLSSKAAGLYAWMNENTRVKSPDADDTQQQGAILGYNVSTYFGLVPKLSRPRIGSIDSIPRDGQTLSGLQFQLQTAGAAKVYPYELTNKDGAAFLKADCPGVPAGDYEVAGPDIAKLDAKALDLKVTVKPGDVFPVFAYNLKLIETKPKLQLMIGTNAVDPVTPKLVNDGATYAFTMTDDKGLCAPAVSVGPILPGTYRLVVDDLPAKYVLPTPCNVVVPLGTSNTFPIGVLWATRPKIQLVDNATGKPLAGIPVKLALNSNKSTKFDFGLTGQSGIADLGKNPAIPPDTYVVEMVGDRLAATLVSPATIVIPPNSVDIFVAKATALKGTLLFEMNRADGAALAGRVKFTVSTDATPPVLVVSDETVAVSEDVGGTDGEIGVDGQLKVAARNVKVDRKELSLDAGKYLVAITDLKKDVLDKQLGWKPGLSKTGKVAVTIEAGQTRKVQFTLTKYSKIQFLGYNVKPGYEPGFRCLVCGAPSAVAEKCKVTGCTGNTSSKRCKNDDCKTFYPEADTLCTKCTATLEPYCTTCSKYSDTRTTCSACGAKTVVNRCASAAPHNVTTGGVCGDMRGPPPGVLCTTVLKSYCAAATCKKYIVGGGIGPCPDCGGDIGFVCTACNQLKAGQGRCDAGHKGGFLGEEQIYLGLPTNTEDLLARCLVMKDAIKTAFTASANTDDDTLKVFMGPEFYFRGVDGAYDADMMPMVMAQLREETKKDIYKDWLFIYGTQIGYLRHEAKSGGKQTYNLKVTRFGRKGTGQRVLHLSKGDGPTGDVITVMNRINPGTIAGLPLPQQWRLSWKNAGTYSREMLVAEPLQANTSCGPDCPKKANPKAEEYYVELLAGGDIPLGEIRLEEPLATEVFNIAMVQKGGAGAGVGSLREVIVYKEWISSIDFLRSTTGNFGGEGRNIYLHGKNIRVIPTEGSTDSLGQNPSKLNGEINSSGIGGGSIFNVDGITFGLEVCLDHLMKKLKRFYSLPAAQIKGAPKIQVSLIPSWGMDIKKDSLVGAVGTLIFNVDGPSGSEAAKVTALGATPTFAKLAAIGTGHVVPQPAAADVTYIDDSVHPPVKKTIAGLNPLYAKLLVQNDHKVNHAKSALAKGYGWIDVFTAEPIPDPDTF